MRLGQLARKLEVRPNQIVEFLATQNIDIDNGTNTRLEPDHVTIAAQHFSPDLPPFEDAGDDAPDANGIAPENGHEAIREPTAESQPENVTDEPPLEKPEVIKAPKIELSGLKVLGKIDLPEVRKKESDQAPENVEPPKESRKERRPREFRRGTPKNPIALQREQEALEARKKREEEDRLRKERRTQNYLKKVKAPQPTKAARIFNEETQQMSASELQEPPKSLWGKFIKWLTN
jgi:hypothetical protein